MSPGEKALTVILPCSRRAASPMKRRLHSLLSLYALSGSYLPPSTIENPFPPSSPWNAPIEAHFSGPPCFPPSEAGSCTPLPVMTRRGFALLASVARSRL